MTIPCSLSSKNFPPLEDTPDVEVGVPSEGGDRPAHTVEEHEPLSPEVGVDEVAGTQGKYPTNEDFVSLFMDDHWRHREGISPVKEVVLPEGVVDEVIPVDNSLTMADANKAFPVFAKDTKAVTFKNVGVARIMGLWGSPGLRLSLEIENQLKEAFTEAEFEAEAFEVIDGVLYMRLKKIDIGKG